MATFQYTATDERGGRLQGTIEAASDGEAAGKLREMGLSPTAVRPVGKPAERDSSGDELGRWVTVRDDGEVLEYRWAKGVMHYAVCVAGVLICGTIFGAALSAVPAGGVWWLVKAPLMLCLGVVVVCALVAPFEQRWIRVDRAGGELVKSVRILLWSKPERLRANVLRAVRVAPLETAPEDGQDTPPYLVTVQRTDGGSFQLTQGLPENVAVRMGQKVAQYLNVPFEQTDTPAARPHVERTRRSWRLVRDDGMILEYRYDTPRVGCSVLFGAFLVSIAVQIPGNPWFFWFIRGPIFFLGGGVVLIGVAMKLVKGRIRVDRFRRELLMVAPILFWPARSVVETSVVARVRLAPKRPASGKKRATPAYMLLLQTREGESIKLNGHTLADLLVEMGHKLADYLDVPFEQSDAASEAGVPLDDGDTADPDESGSAEGG